MTRTVFAFPALILGASLAAFGQAGTPNKVGIIHIQNAIFSTTDGQKAFKELQERFAPRRSELEKKQAEIESLRTQFSKGSNAMSAEQKDKIARDIDAKTKSLNRDTEDAQAELDQENQKIMQELGQRVMAVIDKYAKDNGYSIILDISMQQSPVLYAANGIDVTQDVVNLYNKNAPAAGATPAASKPAPSSTPPAAPVTSPAVKKK